MKNVTVQCKGSLLFYHDGLYFSFNALILTRGSSLIFLDDDIRRCSLSLLDSNLKYDFNLKTYFCEVKS